jgi:hypothetical protein
VVVSGTVLLPPGHAPGEEVEPDTPALRGLAEEKQPAGQLGAALSPEVAAEAADEPVRRLPGLLGLLQKVVIFTSTGQQFNQRSASIDDQRGEGSKGEGEGFGVGLPEMSWLSSNWPRGTGSVRARLPVQAVRRLCTWTQGRLQVRRAQPGHRYFHGCSPHSSHGDPFFPGPPPLEDAFSAGGGSSRFSSIPEMTRGSRGAARATANGAACGAAGRC